MSRKNPEQISLFKQDNVIANTETSPAPSVPNEFNKENFLFKVPPPPSCFAVFERRNRNEQRGASKVIPPPIVLSPQQQQQQQPETFQYVGLKATPTATHPQEPPVANFILPWMSPLEEIISNMPSQPELEDKNLLAAVRCAYGLEGNSTEEHHVYTEAQQQEIDSYFN